MSSSSRLVRSAALCALALTAACASAPKTDAAPGAPTAARSTNLLTAAEIESRGTQTGSAYDAVRRLRPGFLTYHGVSGSTTGAGTVHVSIDGGPLAAVETLRSLASTQIAEVRYLSAADAAQRFGTSAEAGPVLLVRQK
jgi:hypothetical protein